MALPKVRIALFGTSWWADTIYLPGLRNHPLAEVVGCCGRRAEAAAEFAERWGIERSFTNPEAMLDQTEPDAVVIATANDSHHDLALAAIERGLHVLCEKPLGRNVAEAQAMTEAAERRGAITLVPFTYRWMPMNQWVKRLVAEGFVGRPLHINMRYYTEFGFDPAYSWRFDRELAGSGVIGDIGSHWVHLARWFLDDVETSVSATTASFVERAARPDASAYDQAEDSAVLTVRYRSGAYGVLQVSSVCWEGSPFGQSHHLEIHGDAGTIYATCDWDRIQRVDGLKRGESGRSELPIPDDLWGDIRREPVHDTYRDVFRTTDAMTRGWVDAIVAGRSIEPDFAEGLAVQRVIDAAVASAGSDSIAVPIAG